MINNLNVNNDVDLYYKLNISNNSNNSNNLTKFNEFIKYNKIKKINKNSNINLDFENVNLDLDDISSNDFDEYERMIEEIYNDDILNNKSNIIIQENLTNTNNYNIEYDDYIINNNNNNIKIYGNIKNKKEKKKISCDDCGGEDIIEDTAQGILVCTNCGQVVSSIIDCGAEWTQYNDDNKKDMNRCSHPISQLLPQSSMATTIAGSCSSRIRTLHGWSAMPYKERSLNDVFKIIQSKCAKGKIIKCFEDDAKIMYKNISDCKHLEGKNLGKSVIIRGKNRMGVIAACVLYACKKKDKTRSSKEIAKLFGLKHTEINKGCKIFLKLAKIANIELKLNSIDPIQFIVRFCEGMRIKKTYIDQAVQICHNAEILQIASVHTPVSLATGSIYMMGVLNNFDIQKKTIADNFNVSQVTISKAYKKLEPFTNLLMNNDLCERLGVEIKKYQDNIELTDELKIKFIRFNIDVEKTFDQKYNTSALYNILDINTNNNKYDINWNLSIEHGIEIDTKLKQVENEFLKLNLNYINELHNELSKFKF